MSTTKDSTLVQIGRSKSALSVEQPADSSEQQSKGLSRRKFLKVLGASSAVGAAGCANDQLEHVFPFVKGEPELIPGVASWYRSTCRECSANCGIQVRVREGRAVKIEGNPEHPVNHGGLCGLGQSALEGLYDPDRVRQPLVRETVGGFDPVFRPISWDEAYARVAAALKDKATKKAFICGEQTGALDTLIDQWCNEFNTERVTYDLLQATALAQASALVYGTYGIPNFEFAKSQVILSLGADFLETWISPVGYARGWAKARRAEVPAKFIHIEPRLSLTGANADMWMSSKPGSETRIALALLRFLLDTERGANLRDDVREALRAMTRNARIQDVAAESGISADKLLYAANALKDAEGSLVLAGGAAASVQDQLPLQVVVAFINLVLGNVGKTINLNAMRTPKSSLPKLAATLEAMNKGEIGAVFLHGTNPQFTLPLAYGFRYAMDRVRVGGEGNSGKLGLVVSFSSYLDETAQLADLILPSHHPLEEWGDERPMQGVFSLLQPTMRPVFDTRSFGDMLLQLASLAGASDVAGGASNFQAYLKDSWKRLHSSLSVREDFETFWLKSVERGGYFPGVAASTGVRVNVSAEALRMKFDSASFAHPKVEHDAPVLLAYPSVKTFDGRAANRPWLQELPDPITRAVWDAWAEIHPKTAAAHGLAAGDLVTVRNAEGEVTVPVYVTEYVHQGVVAVPLGQGHEAYGRIARKVSNANVLHLIPKTKLGAADNLPLLSTRVQILRARGKASFVRTQQESDQRGREIARTKFISAATAAAVGHAADAHGHDDHGGHHGHHEPKQMYVQREHPMHKWGMAIDLNACTGCGACVVACYAENNIAVVGKEACGYGREMSWLRIDRYYEGPAEELLVTFQPMLCQHCGNAPCEPVCPVYATYHNPEGLNAMIYNRCVGTRYCSNNCPYKVRRFNFFEYDLPEPLNWQLNPDVTRRSMGVMEKCSFCVQRIVEGQDRAKDEGRPVRDGEIQTACAQSCPTNAIVFGDLNDPNSAVSRLSHKKSAYKVLDHHINTQPAISYLEQVKYRI